MVTRGVQVIDIVYYGHLKSNDGSIQHKGDNLTGAGPPPPPVVLVTPRLLPHTLLPHSLLPHTLLPHTLLPPCPTHQATATTSRSCSTWPPCTPRSNTSPL